MTVIELPLPVPALHIREGSCTVHPATLIPRGEISTASNLRPRLRLQPARFSNAALTINQWGGSDAAVWEIGVKEGGGDHTLVLLPRPDVECPVFPLVSSLPVKRIIHPVAIIAVSAHELEEPCSDTQVRIRRLGKCRNVDSTILQKAGHTHHVRASYLNSIRPRKCCHRACKFPALASTELLAPPPPLELVVQRQKAAAPFQVFGRTFLLQTNNSVTLQEREKLRKLPGVLPYLPPFGRMKTPYKGLAFSFFSGRSSAIRQLKIDYFVFDYCRPVFSRTLDRGHQLVISRATTYLSNADVELGE